MEPKVKYIRHNITLPENISKLLRKERNQSKRVTETLRDYYLELAKLGSLDTRLHSIEDKTEVIRRTVQDIEQLIHRY